MGKILENNQAIISGEIVSRFGYSHKGNGTKFYIAIVEVPRKSGTTDRIPVMFSDKLINPEEDLRGLNVNVYGHYSSFNKREKERKKLMLYVFATEVEFSENALKDHENNVIYLEGNICKEPLYRKTPQGKEITDFLIAVNRDNQKSDYIPCICWWKTAKFVSNLEVGTRVVVKGRIQSREYTKYEGEQPVVKVAYDFSAKVVEVVK